MYEVGHSRKSQKAMVLLSYLAVQGYKSPGLVKFLNMITTLKY